MAARQTFDQTLHPHPTAQQQHTRNRQTQDDKGQVVAQLGQAHRTAKVKPCFRPQAKRRAPQRVQTGGPMHRVQGRWPKFQNLRRLAVPDQGVDFPDQPIRAAIGLFGGQDGGLQPRQLFVQRRASVGDFLGFGLPVGGRIAKRLNLVAQGVDARAVDALGRQEPAAPRDQLAAQLVKGRVGRAPCGDGVLGAGGDHLPRGVIGDQCLTAGADLGAGGLLGQRHRRPHHPQRENQRQQTKHGDQAS